MIAPTIDIENLRNAINQIEEELKAVRDLAPRIENTNPYALMREYGLDVDALKRDALTLEYNLGYNLQVLKDTLELYESSGV
jgi:hypothetical protein